MKRHTMTLEKSHNLNNVHSSCSHHFLFLCMRRMLAGSFVAGHNSSYSLAAELACAASLLVLLKLVPPGCTVTAEERKSVFGGDGQTFSVKNTASTPSHSLLCSSVQVWCTTWKSVNNISGTSLLTSPPRTRALRSESVAAPPSGYFRRICAGNWSSVYWETSTRTQFT